MKTKYSVWPSYGGDDSCNGVSITVETEDYHRDSTAIYKRIIEVLTESLPMLKSWEDSDGNQLKKVELEIRDYSEREYPNGMPNVITLQNNTIPESDGRIAG